MLDVLSSIVIIQIVIVNSWPYSGYKQSGSNDANVNVKIKIFTDNILLCVIRLELYTGITINELD